MSRLIAVQGGIRCDGPDAHGDFDLNIEFSHQQPEMQQVGKLMISKNSLFNFPLIIFSWTVKCQGSLPICFNHKGETDYC